MGVYNDLACDAGYAYGTPENEQMAQMIEAEEQRQYYQQEEFEHFYWLIGIAEFISENFTTA